MIIQIGKSLKYNGTRYPANTPIEVEEKDVEYLKSQGAWVIVESAPVRPSESIDPEVDEEESNEADAELKALQLEAKELGIKPGKKGIERLKAEIESMK